MGKNRHNRGNKPSYSSGRTTTPIHKLPKPSTSSVPLGGPITSGRPLVTSSRTYVVVPQFPIGHPQYGLSTGPVGSPGKYKIIFILAIPGINVVQENSDFVAMLNGGDSLLQVPSDTSLNLCINTPIEGGEFEKQDIGININSKDRVGSLELILKAENFADATKRSHDVAMPILSKWSFKHDVAITISSTHITELSSSVFMGTHLIVGAVKTFSDSKEISTQEERILLSSYREGISSTEPLHKALSLLKVIEGVYNLRYRRKKDVVVGGEEYRDLNERIPKQESLPSNTQYNKDLKEDLKSYEGQKFTKVRETLRVVLRNSIAHLDPGRDPFTADSYSDLQQIEKAFPVLKYMSRVLLENELNQNQGQ